MICNFMIFSESVGSGACLSAIKPDNQAFVVFALILRPELHNFTPNGNY